MVFILYSISVSRCGNRCFILQFVLAYCFYEWFSTLIFPMCDLYLCMLLFVIICFISEHKFRSLIENFSFYTYIIYLRFPNADHDKLMSCVCTCPTFVLLLFMVSFAINLWYIVSLIDWFYNTSFYPEFVLYWFVDVLIVVHHYHVSLSIAECRWSTIHSNSYLNSLSWFIE